MSFRLVPKSVNLNDLKRRNGPYFALLHRIREVVEDVVVKKFTFAISSPDKFLVAKHRRYNGRLIGNRK